jgi:alkylhydroperoxidase family enzyme
LDAGGAGATRKVAVFLDEPPVDAAVAASYAECEDGCGYVMNYRRAWAWRQDVASAFGSARDLLGSTTALSPLEVAVINSSVAGSRDDAACALAWGTRLAEHAAPEVAADVLRGQLTGLDPRSSALARWATLVATDPNATTQADVQALRDAGLDDRAIVEATVLAAFRLAFTAVNDALGTEPDAELSAAAPAAVRAAVTFGRPS